MTTLKLTKPPKEPATAARPPVRRADPAKRQRVATTKNDNANRDINIAPAKSVGAQLIARKEPKATDAAPRPENQGQRNHRFDGKPRQDSMPKNGGQDRDTPRRGGKERDGFEPGEFNKHRATNPKFAPKP
ncbi:MAG TPA: pseudouridine synthase, partial [Methylophilaceae bacterium]|nr:pseudouridine synthase [Methylophilaceae bacterium]